MPGKTSYQIKSGQFKPSQISQIRNELFGTKTPSRQHLGESIRLCLGANGAYVLVCTGLDLVATELSSARNHIKEYLQQCGYTQAKVEVWSQNNLIGFLESFPSLALQRERAVMARHFNHTGAGHEMLICELNLSQGKSRKN